MSERRSGTGPDEAAGDAPRVAGAGDPADAGDASRAAGAAAAAGDDQTAPRLRPADLNIGRLFWIVRDAVIVADAESGRIVLWNPAAEALFGYPADAIVGRSIEVLVPERLRARHRAALGAYAARGHGPLVDSGRPVELPAVRADGVELTVELALNPLTAGGGEPALTPPGAGGGESVGAGRYVHATVRDVTERRRAEEALRAANAELEQFAYTVSHDLKAPLVSIQGFVHRLVQHHAGPLDATGRHYLERIRANAARLADLIDAVLAYSRVGRVGSPPAPVDLGEALDRSLEGLAALAERSGAMVRPAAPLPVVVVSPTLLGQILDNLLANALTYGAQPGAAPAVEVGCDDRGERWRLWVRDRGPGIPLDQQDRLFHLFERLPAGQAAVPGGTGVGLATVRKAAEAAGGAAGVDSAPGAGATFWVELPKGVA